LSPDQRYISDELTHFVGAHLKEVEDAHERAEQRYGLLLKILEEGQLRSQTESRSIGRFVGFSPKEKLGRMIRGTFISYCDIPVDDIAIHVSKYSEFGIAFSREFLLRKGANPVLYLAENALVDGDNSETAGELWEREVPLLMEFLQDLMWAEEKTERGEVPEDVQRAAISRQAFVFQRILPLIKPFRADLEDEHPDNFYMEREWRSYGDLDFDLSDVRRIFVPEGFAKRLREDVPDYFGQVTFPR
jgi:hypothetical protein